MTADAKRFLVAVGFFCRLRRGTRARKNRGDRPCDQCRRDDERNPPETGLITQAMKRVKNGKLYLILASDETSGHLTTGTAKFYKKELQKLLEEAPRRGM